MKRCTVYDVLRNLLRGGYICWSCTVRDCRKIQLFHNGKIVGKVPTKVFEKLVNIGIIGEYNTEHDKNNTTFSYYGLSN